MSSEISFRAYREPLETVTSFKYLGRVLMSEDDYWLAVAVNLSKARKIWVQMTRILIREGAEPKVSVLLFKAVVKAVFLFGTETWFLNPRAERSLRNFRHRVARRLIVSQLRRRGEGRW